MSPLPHPNGIGLINPFKIGDYARGIYYGSIIRVDKIIDYHTIEGTTVESKVPEIKVGEKIESLCISTVEKINNVKTDIFK